MQPKNRDHVYFDEPVVRLENLSGLEGGTSYPDASIRSRGRTAEPGPAFGYWPDPLPENRPGLPARSS